MKRALVAGLLALSACDFEKQYDDAWCAKHPTDPACGDGGARDADTDAGTPDAGTPDAGEVDAGRVLDAGERDAGAVDAGVTDAGGMDAGAMDAGGPCTARRLVIDAPDGGEAGLCTPITVRAVCDDDGRPAPVTRVTELVLTSTITGGITARGDFFTGSVCNTLLSSRPTLLATQDTLSTFFKTSAFGRYSLEARPIIQMGEQFAPANHTLEQYAELSFATSPVVKVPTDAGCVDLPLLSLRSTASPMVVAPSTLVIAWPLPSNLQDCSGGVTLNLFADTQLSATISLRALSATPSQVPITITTAEPLVRTTSIQVRPCQAAGPTNDPLQCCAGTDGNACL